MSNTFPRIRTPIPSGYFLGRTSAGTGVVEAVHIKDLATQIVATGIAQGTGGSNPPQWTAGGVSNLGTVAGGATLGIANGTLQATGGWSAGGVTAIGAGLTITAGTLVASGGTSHIYAPAVNGSIPGPGLLADPTGQCIMVPTT